MAALTDSKMIAEVIRCTNFAAIKHATQRRKDPEKTPYINHPIGVANILTEEAKITDIQIIQAALLHDTVEDTDTTYEELVNNFGKEVADIVMEVTDDKTLPTPERKRLEVEHAPHLSQKAKFVKLADKLYNLRDLVRVVPVGWSAERVQGYFVWVSQIVAGLRGTCSVLEEAMDKLFSSRGISC